MQPRWTERAVLPGGDLPAGGLPAFIAELARRFPALPADLLRDLARRHGTRSLAILGAAPALIAKLLVGGFLLALIETLSAKMRIFRAPEFLGTAFLLAVLAMLVNQMLGS
jgi:hypothetical protein